MRVSLGQELRRTTAFSSCVFKLLMTQASGGHERGLDLTTEAGGG